MRDDGETFEVQQLSPMQSPSWTEGRLDDLNRKVDKGFDKVDGRFDKVDERFEKVDERFEKVSDEFKAVRGEMHAGFVQTQRMFLGAVLMVIVAVIGAPHV